jgi:hypothetical protein
MESTVDLNFKSRLIVLIPDGMTGNRDLAYKLHGMAQRENRDVFYLALADYEENRLAVSRSLATMKAVTSSDDLEVLTETIESPHWIEALREIYCPGDMIVCHEEQSVRYGLINAGPLDEFVRKQLGMPVRTISGFYHPQEIQLKRWGREILYWLGFIVILVLFSVLEIELDRVIRGGMQTVVLCVALCVELVVIMTWHSSRSKTQ